MRCLSCSDVGRNARTGYACLECPAGLAILRDELEGVRQPLLTDRLIRVYRELQAIMAALPEGVPWPTELAVNGALGETMNAINSVADMETVRLLRGGLAERRAALAANGVASC